MFEQFAHLESKANAQFTPQRTRDDGARRGYEPDWMTERRRDTKE
jgi:hypothetical protein